MTLRLIAKPVVAAALPGLQQRVQSLGSKGIVPCLKVILLGHHPPSVLYTRNKQRFCERLGAKCEIVELAPHISSQALRSKLQHYNDDSQVHGCLVQLPLPQGLSQIAMDDWVVAHKDVDGFHLASVGGIYRGGDETKLLTPCTPKGIVKLLQHYHIPLAGQHVVIIGRSRVVGRPLALMMTNHDATVTLCHSQTRDIKGLTRSADIIVSAVGKPGFLAPSFIGAKPPVIVDVGINLVQGKLCGDAQFEALESLCQGITPVPGGVGPLTVLSLAENLILAAEHAAHREGGGHGP